MERPAEVEQAILAMPPGDLDAHLLRPMADGEPHAHRGTCVAPALAWLLGDGMFCVKSLSRHATHMCQTHGEPG